MRIADKWKDYSIIATGDGMKLERWGSVYLLRPDPQVIWPQKANMSGYKSLNAIYHRSENGGGKYSKKCRRNGRSVTAILNFSSSRWASNTRGFSPSKP